MVGRHVDRVSVPLGTRLTDGMRVIIPQAVSHHLPHFIDCLFFGWSSHVRLFLTPGDRRLVGRSFRSCLIPVSAYCNLDHHNCLRRF